MVACISIVFSAPDATLLRCLQQDGTSNYTILVWKTLFYTLIQAAFGVHATTTERAKAKGTTID